MISGFADGVDAEAEGFVTILLAIELNEQMVYFMVEDVPKRDVTTFRLD